MATIHIQCGKDNLTPNKKSSKLHRVPFKIHADCDAPVADYFDKYVRKKDDGTFTGSFRGYPLRGKKVKVPKGYMGLVLHESIKPSTEKEERKVYVINRFEDFTFWNWDKVTGPNDSISRALEWIDIAEALHRPVTQEDLNSQSALDSPSTSNEAK